MIFRSITLAGGAVSRKNAVDSRRMPVGKVALAGAIWAQAHRTGEPAGLGIPSLPDVTLRAGIPAKYGDASRPERLWSIGNRGEEAFQIAALIPAHLSIREALAPLTTVIAISRAIEGLPTDPGLAGLPELVQSLWDARPCVVYALEVHPNLQRRIVEHGTELTLWLAAARLGSSSPHA